MNSKLYSKSSLKNKQANTIHKSRNQNSMKSHFSLLRTLFLQASLYHFISSSIFKEWNVTLGNRIIYSKCLCSICCYSNYFRWWKVSHWCEDCLLSLRSSSLSFRHIIYIFICELGILTSLYSYWTEVGILKANFINLISDTYMEKRWTVPRNACLFSWTVEGQRVRNFSCRQLLCRSLWSWDFD